MRSIYRDDYVRSHAARWKGEASLSHRLSFTVASVAGLALVAGLIALLCFASATRKVSAHGMLVSQQGVVQLFARTAGVVVSQSVPIGTHVEKGTTLFQIRTDGDLDGGSVSDLVAPTLKRRRESIQMELDNSKGRLGVLTSAFAARTKSVNEQLTALADEERLLTRRTELAEQARERFRQVAKEGFVSQSQMQAKEEELLDLQGRAASISRTRRALTGELSQIEVERTAALSQLIGSIAQLERALQATEQERLENEARGSAMVVSPAAGELSVVNVSPGATVHAQQPLASFLIGDDSRERPILDAELYVSSRAVGFVSKGQEVWMRFDAFPYQKFGLRKGVVTRVDDSPVTPSDLTSEARTALSAFGPFEPLYRVRVSVSTTGERRQIADLPLKPGMLFEADIVQERRALWEWIFEPLIGAHKRYASSSRG